MLPVPERPTLATHWGTYRVARDANGIRLEGYELDPDPSPIAQGMVAARVDACRIRKPAIRASFLELGHGASGAGRGSEPFVEVEWAEAIEIVAGQLERVRGAYGNQAIFGGSAGWASAGRFHHAQSQIHRFLNCIGGYTKSILSYSYGAGEVILPHVLGDTSGLMAGHTPWAQIIGKSDLIVMFGGTARKNSQVNSGGIGRHSTAEALTACREAGARFVSVSPIRDDTMAELEAEWVPLRPNSDVALMLAIAHTIISENLHDRDFLERYTVGFVQLEAYILGKSDGVAKTADWAQPLCEIEATVIRNLARRMATSRTFIMGSYSIQRANHGEQAYWMLIALAAMLGTIGLPGGGFGFGYSAVNGVGNALPKITWPSLPQGENAVSEFIPVARISDMLLNPGAEYDFNGQRRRYPDCKIVYWAGGNPFHHQQDLNRLMKAWAKPEVVIVNEGWWNATARRADIVLPVTTQLERNDIVCSNKDRMLAASHAVEQPFGEARDDYAIFSDLARQMGVEAAFTEGRSEEEWLRHLFAVARQRAAEIDVELPQFDDFWREGVVLLPEPEHPAPLFQAFRQNPERHPLPTPSGRIELYSQRIASFGYDDCPGHPCWIEPHEWLGAPQAKRFPLHLLSNQPRTKLHSQYDNGPHARAAKHKGREPLRLNPQDAAERGIADGDIVRMFNDRGACLAAAFLSDAVRPGVVQLATGSWFDPTRMGTDEAICKHGNPNVLTQDRGTSRLAQSSSAQSCLIEIEPYRGELPEISCFDAPVMVARGAGRKELHDG